MNLKKHEIEDFSDMDSDYQPEEWNTWKELGTFALMLFACAAFSLFLIVAYA